MCFQWVIKPRKLDVYRSQDYVAVRFSSVGGAILQDVAFFLYVLRCCEEVLRGGWTVKWLET